MGVFVCLWVCYHDNSKLRASLHQTGFGGKGSDHLQLIKVWPSRAPGKGVCGGAKNLAPPYYNQRGVCVSSERFFIVCRAATVQGDNNNDAGRKLLDKCYTRMVTLSHRDVASACGYNELTITEQ